MNFKFPKLFYKKKKIKVGTAVISKIKGSQIIYITPKLHSILIRLSYNIVTDTFLILVIAIVIGRLTALPIFALGFLAAILWIIGICVHIVYRMISERTTINLLHRQLKFIKHGKIKFDDVEELKKVKKNLEDEKLSSYKFQYELHLVLNNGDRIIIAKSDDTDEIRDAYQFLKQEMKLYKIKWSNA